VEDVEETIGPVLRREDGEGNLDLKSGTCREGRGIVREGEGTIGNEPMGVEIMSGEEGGEISKEGCL
jgi:hypothetical protein